MADNQKAPLNAEEQAALEQTAQAAESAEAADAPTQDDTAPAPAEKPKNGRAKKPAAAKIPKADTEAEAEAEADTEAPAKDTPAEEPEADKADDTQAAERGKTTYKADKLPPKPPKSKEQLEWEAARREKFNRTVWQPIIRPIVALVAICIVTSLLLGLTNAATAPIIAANNAAAADEARQALLPAADSFTQLPLTAEYSNVTAIYAANNGSGWVVDAFGKGYGGEVPAMVAFGQDGAIAGVTFLQNNETPGLGKKLETQKSFREQFTGRPAEAIAMSSIDKIASSTISTGAALTAVNAAIDAFNAEVQGVSGGPSTPEEVRAWLLPGATLEAIQAPAGAEGVQPTAWRDTATGNIIAYGEAQGVHSTVVAAVAADPDGTILNLWLDTSGETEGIGTPVQSNKAFVESFIGLDDVAGVDAIADATLTSDAIKAAVANVLAVVPELADAPPDPAGGTENTAGGGDTGNTTSTPPDTDDSAPAGPSAEETAAALLPGETLQPFSINGAAGYGSDAWLSDTGNMVVFGRSEGKNGVVTVAVALSGDGAVLALLPDVSGETEGIGQLVPLEQAFMDGFIGLDSAADVANIDAVADATLTSEAIKTAVTNVLNDFEWIQAAAEQEVG